MCRWELLEVGFRGEGATVSSSKDLVFVFRWTNTDYSLFKVESLARRTSILAVEDGAKSLKLSDY